MLLSLHIINTIQTATEDRPSSYEAVLAWHDSPLALELREALRQGLAVLVLGVLGKPVEAH